MHLCSSGAINNAIVAIYKIDQILSIPQWSNQIRCIKMRLIILSCAILCCSYAASLPNDNDLFIRSKRQFIYDSGVKGTVSGRRTLFDWNGRKVEGYGQMSRTWDLRQPTVFGGGFDGTSVRGRYSLSSGYQRDKGLNLGSNARYNLYKNKNTAVDAYAGYDRTLGAGSNSNRGIGLDIQRTV